MVTTIDGKTIRRQMPKTEGAHMQFMMDMRNQGDDKIENLLSDADGQGVWGEVVYPSLGLWYDEMDDPDLANATSEVLNDWVAEEILNRYPRFVSCATLPLQSVELSVKEVER
jgi:predicted TIM-barrel fold metal-dependent hydrolase